MDHLFSPMERTVLFIDGANLHAACRALSLDVDFAKLLRHFGRNRRLTRAFYYTAMPDQSEHTPLRPLVDWLSYNGYTPVTKPMKEFTDAAGRKRSKGNMDIELAVDMLEMAPYMDHAILFSGDGDFRRLVEAVQRKGVKVTVVSTFKTPQPVASDELRRQADAFVDLYDLRNHLARAPRGRSDDEPDTRTIDRTVGPANGQADDQLEIQRRSAAAADPAND